MAKNDNLKDFLTDVANAIRAKKGTMGPINPQNFSAEIAAIETGGGSVSVQSGAVNFRDYDGTILHSYSKNEFLALIELPELSTQQGLICQGWNYNLEDAQNYVSEYGVLEVGATYITDDGKTRLYISVPKYRQNVSLYFSQTVAQGVTIDWGDGSSTQTLSGTGNRNITHSYANEGDYLITLDVADGCTLGLGSEKSNYSVLGSNGGSGRVYCNMLKRVALGQGITTIGSYAFKCCYSLSSVIIPQSVISIGSDAFQSCYSLSSVIIPQSVISIGDNVLQNCYTLSLVIIPQSVTKISYGMFYNNSALSSVIIPQGVTSIGGSAFYTCSALSSVIIPQGVTSINAGAFNTCNGMALYDFRALASVPTLGSTNAFSSIRSDCKIVVPDALYDEWIAATNWSTYASNIVKASEYNG